MIINTNVLGKFYSRGLQKNIDVIWVFWQDDHFFGV